MRTIRYLIVAIFVTNGCLLYSQSYEYWTTSFFTWEGANTGNKAVWNPNDTLNNYISDGVNVKVTMKDPFKLNTTTTNLSEFNDFTKTNAFYGKANLALQIKSQTSGQPFCMEFEFSKPVKLSRFNVFDIDMLQSGSNLLSTYQDSIHFKAFNINGEVPLTLSALSLTPTYTIYGQAAKANFFSGINGDVAHTNPNGGLLISSNEPIQKFILCYANGFEDDGTSNSHAVKILGFDYQEVIGRIEGTVYEYGTNITLSGSKVSLIDDLTGLPVFNKAGQLMEVTTNNTGNYVFPSLPLGRYRVVQVDPPLYESHSDIDGANDNLIITELNFNKTISLLNDFYETSNAPLPVNIGNLALVRVKEHEYNLSWMAYREVNNDFYEISLSADGVHFESIGKIEAQNLNGSRYSFDFFNTIQNNVTYVKLEQTDFDGTTSIVGIKTIQNAAENNEVAIFPNPVSDICTIDFSLPNDHFQSFTVYDSFGRMVQETLLPQGVNRYDYSVASLPSGVYFIYLKGSQPSKNIRLIKQ